MDYQSSINFSFYNWSTFESVHGIDEINLGRQGHNTPLISCSKRLEDDAQAWAQELFDRGINWDGKFSLLKNGI